MALIPINIKVTDDVDYYITAEMDAQIYSRIIPDGVIAGVGNECNITYSDNRIAIGSGLMCIQGYLAIIKDNLIIEVDSPEKKYIKAKISLGADTDTWGMYVSDSSELIKENLFNGGKIKEILIGTIQNGIVEQSQKIASLSSYLEELTNKIPEMKSMLESEKSRVESEEIREQNENQRLASEYARKQDEQIRIQQENLREEAENSRISTHTSIMEEERNRVESEQIRASNESERVTAELERASNEVKRHNWYENTKSMLGSNPVGNLINRFNDFRNSQDQKNLEINNELNGKVSESELRDIMQGINNKLEGKASVSSINTITLQIQEIIANAGGIKVINHEPKTSDITGSRDGTIFVEVSNG